MNLRQADQLITQLLQEGKIDEALELRDNICKAGRQDFVLTSRSVNLYLVEEFKEKQNFEQVWSESLEKLNLKNDDIQLHPVTILNMLRILVRSKNLEEENVKNLLSKLNDIKLSDDHYASIQQLRISCAHEIDDTEKLEEILKLLPDKTKDAADSSYNGAKIKHLIEKGKASFVPNCKQTADELCTTYVGILKM